MGFPVMLRNTFYKITKNSVQYLTAIYVNKFISCTSLLLHINVILHKHFL